MRTNGRRQGYAYEADRRKAQLMRIPRNLEELLAWFTKAYREEMPEALHAGGLWRDRVSPGEDAKGIAAMGGSLLGTPRTAEGFRRLTEDGPFTMETAEYEGHKDRSDHYTFPLRAALARLAGRERATDQHGFMAYALITTARLDGDWDRALSSLGVNPPAVRRAYIEVALRRVYEKYEVEPLSRAA